MINTKIAVLPGSRNGKECLWGLEDIIDFQREGHLTGVLRIELRIC